jgi:predicted dehydrogenase
MTTDCALIGLGMVSAIYADALVQLAGRVRLIGVHAQSATSRTAFAARHAGLAGADRAYESVEEIAADKAVDFVILTTPPNARQDIVETLARAGKHILMEKPVERSLPAAIRLCGTAKDAGITLGIMLQHRARPSARALAARISAGDLGPLAAVEVSVPWWRPQSYYDAPGRGTYARDGGGVLISQAIHTLDLMLSLTGPVAEVTAMTSTSTLHRMESEDFVTAGLRFAGGAVGSLFATTASFPGQPESITLHHRHATARLLSNRLTIHWHDGRVEEEGAATTTGAGADPMAFTADWHRDMIADFAEAIVQGRPPLVPGTEALHVHRLIAAIERAGGTAARTAVET